MGQQAHLAQALTRSPGEAMAAPRLEFRKVTRCFNVKGRGGGVAEPVVAVTDVSLAIGDGEVVSLIGPSGCGKSTLLTMAAGLDRPNAGEVFVDGHRVEGPNRQVAFMLQKDLLMPWRTILGNIELGLEIRGEPRETRRARAADHLERCRLGKFGHHYPHQLSGGMRQRAALARTLAVDPDVILLDEPFSAVDAQTKMVLQSDFSRAFAQERRTALFITHDLAEAVALSDRVLVMSQRPGTIVREIVVDIPDRANPFARRQSTRMTEYVRELMALLHINEGDH